jgi:hypothetical protein
MLKDCCLCLSYPRALAKRIVTGWLQAPPDTSGAHTSNELIERLQSLIVQFHLPVRFCDVHITRAQLQRVASRFAARGASLIAGSAASEHEVMSLLESAL